jgi:anti-sigma factor RsiW
MMNRDEILELLSDYLDDRLDRPTRAAVEAGLARHPECRRALEQLRETVALLGSLPKASAPEGLAAAVSEKARRQAVLTRSKREMVAAQQRRLVLWNRLLPAAAVLAVGSLAALAVWRAQHLRPAPRRPVAADYRPVDPTVDGPPAAAAGANADSETPPAENPAAGNPAPDAPAPAGAAPPSELADRGPADVGLGSGVEYKALKEAEAQKAGEKGKSFDDQARKRKSGFGGQVGGDVRRNSPSPERSDGTGEPNGRALGEGAAAGPPNAKALAAAPGAGGGAGGAPGAAPPPPQATAIAGALTTRRAAQVENHDANVKQDSAKDRPGTSEKSGAVPPPAQELAKAVAVPDADVAMAAPPEVVIVRGDVPTVVARFREALADLPAGVVEWSAPAAGADDRTLPSFTLRTDDPAVVEKVLAVLSACPTATRVELAPSAEAGRVLMDALRAEAGEADQRDRAADAPPPDALSLRTRGDDKPGQDKGGREQFAGKSGGAPSDPGRAVQGGQGGAGGPVANRGGNGVVQHPDGRVQYSAEARKALEERLRRSVDEQAALARGLDNAARNAAGNKRTEADRSDPAPHRRRELLAQAAEVGVQLRLLQAAAPEVPAGPVPTERQANFVGEKKSEGKNAPGKRDEKGADGAPAPKPGLAGPAGGAPQSAPAAPPAPRRSLTVVFTFRPDPVAAPAAPGK